MRAIARHVVVPDPDRPGWLAVHDTGAGHGHGDRAWTRVPATAAFLAAELDVCATEDALADIGRIAARCLREDGHTVVVSTAGLPHVEVDPTDAAREITRLELQR
jgi:hypothetical protein